MGFALICFQCLSLPDVATAVLLAEQPIHQRSVHLGPLVLKTDSRKFLTPTTDRDRTVSRRSTQLACHFNGRTAQPLGPSPAPGCDEPTSRCKPPVDVSSWGDQPVIPGVPLSFERWPFHTEPPDHYALVSNLIDL